MGSTDVSDSRIGMDNPELYKQVSQPQAQDFRWVFENFGNHLHFRPYDRVLDIGCGPGDLTKDVIFPRMAPFSELIGIDLSGKMIDFAERNSKLPGIGFIQQDANKIGELQRYYPSGETLKDLGKMVRKDGTLFLLFVESCTIFDIYLEFSRSDKYGKHMKASEIRITS
ncbi:unnamed protein product [Notodromas monacha]|uniref:Methyltransferase domain-containing protein n=1 Tax=Notodromas monacha TaxID=399045 RepID=A0A7R9BMW7_9CRUS|nr:unnamed protein product [Notodromas monacha]CAG0918447.1 unnamed protein product [Notodromas monacha]